MIVGLGIDVFEVSRMERVLHDGDEHFNRDLFTPSEISYCNRQRYPAQHYAARFAAKEAVVKALGLDGADGTHWREIEICVGRGGVRYARLHGTLAALAKRRRISRVLLSLSHTRRLAIASAVLER